MQFFAGWIQGALDGGLDIPHSEKRFAGFSKDSKQLDAEVHRKYIYGGHIATYMKVIEWLYGILFTIIIRSIEMNNRIL